MAAFQEFLSQLFDEGKVVFRAAGPPQDPPAERDLIRLRDAFGTLALTVAGPRVEFDPRIACEAAELVRQASWALVNRNERVGGLKRRLRMAGTPTTPSHHLSADLLLRYLPQILKRARGLDPTDPLIGILADVLRRWPLSGILSDIEDGPLVAPDFAGHPGLLLLYAERLSANDRSSWRPDPSSPAYEYYELVLADRSAADPSPPSQRIPGEDSR